MSTHADLTARLQRDGLLPADWAAAFTAVDRGAFIPRRCWFTTAEGTTHPLDRDENPGQWAAAVYSDQPIVTQLDDGATSWPHTSRNATSSASQPSLVLGMLDALDVQDGHRVLEIGTGTGYNAALLCHRLGDRQVTTVEIDATVAEQAQAALRQAGCQPTAVLGDGGEGYPPGAPYDRVVVTASVLAGQVPTTWLAQVAVGGQLLLPWRTTWGSGVLVRLVVQDDGTAVGPVLGDAYFMSLRGQRTRGHASEFGRRAEEATGVPVTTTTVSPREVVENPDCSFAVGLHLLDVQHSLAHETPDDAELLLYHAGSGSWAMVRTTPEHAAEGSFPVREHGPRQLWAEAEIAYHWWVRQGRPARTSYGLVVSGSRQWVQLGSSVSSRSLR